MNYDYSEGSKKGNLDFGDIIKYVTENPNWEDEEKEKEKDKAKRKNSKKGE